MADIFVSYTSSDRDWAFWIGQELEKLGHVAHVHEWELPVGGDIPAWMEERVQKADQVLCVVSAAYLTKDYSSWERRSAQWAAQRKRQNFVAPVFVEDCEAPVTFAHIKRCELFGLSEDDARTRLKSDLAPVAKPLGPTRFPGAKPGPFPFPGEAQPEKPRAARQQAIAHESKPFALSNIPINVPRHFLGRDDALAAIDAALKRDEGRVEIAALHGMRGVGKTTLAAAYADRHRAEYRATWWIRAQTESTLRADLVSLGVRLGWIAAEEKEELALAAVRECLRDEGERLLLIFDNAFDAPSVKKYLPRGDAARVLVTSNAHAWRGVAASVEIRLWPKEIGADYLLARTGRDSERAEAEALSLALGGLPLALEQAAAYCDRLEVSLAEYRKRFDATPARLLDTPRDAPAEYHDGLTVAKTFALAIDEATKLHPAAEPLIVHAALLAPEPIPLFVFSEGREKFGEPLTSQLADDGLEEAVAALRTFALVDRETISDERDPTIITETIRLHRLVRAVAAGRLQGATADLARRALTEATAAVYPGKVFNDPSAWPRARRLDALAFDLVGSAAPPKASVTGATYLLDGLAAYRQAVLADYDAARPLYEGALRTREKALGPEHPDTANSLNNLAVLLYDQGDLGGARRLHERALAIRENRFGPDHPDTGNSINNLAVTLRAQGDSANARSLFERALAISERTHGAEHPTTAQSLDNLAKALSDLGDIAGALPLLERSLAIRENTLGAQHPDTATGLNNLALVLRDQADFERARSLIERALAIQERNLGSEHPDTATSLNNLAAVFGDQNDFDGARQLFQRALGIRKKVLGAQHPDTAQSLLNVATSLWEQGNLSGARPLFEEALQIYQNALGANHPVANLARNRLGFLRLQQGAPSEALELSQVALAGHNKVLGAGHAWTIECAFLTAAALNALGRPHEAAAVRAKYRLGGGPAP